MTRCLSRFFCALALCAFSTVSSFAENHKIYITPQFLSFDHRGQSYISGRVTDNLITAHEVSRKFLIKQTNNSHPFLKYALLSSAALVSARLHYANGYVLHEYAHAEGPYRYGFSNIMVGEANPDGTNVRSNNSYLQNILRMAYADGNPFNFSYRGVSPSYTGTFPSQAANALHLGAGLNLNTFLAERDHTAFISEGYSPARGMNYLINKVFNPVYFILDDEIGGDPSDYVKALRNQGIFTSKGEIQTYNLASLFLSNGFWTSVRGLPSYFEAENDIKPLSWLLPSSPYWKHGEVYWPEFSTYLNGEGVSFAANFHGRFDDSLIHIAFEANVIGKNKGTDVTVGLEQKFNSFSLAPELTLNTQGGYFAKLNASFEINDNIGFEATVFTGDGNSLKGKRMNITAGEGGYCSLVIKF